MIRMAELYRSACPFEFEAWALVPKHGLNIDVDIEVANCASAPSTGAGYVLHNR